jgi:sugar-specific transcriptional regulator TrmB
VYKTLTSLIKKGLVKRIDSSKVIQFAPTPPTKLQQRIEKEYVTLEQVRNSFQTIFPTLLSTYTLSVERPVVRTFEGVTGLQEIFEDTLQAGQPICAISQVTAIDPTLYKWLTDYYVKQRVKRKIHAQMLVATGEGAKEYQRKDDESFRTTRLIPKEQFPFTHEIDVYGDKVAIIHFKKDQPLIGMIITHAGIAQTMRAWFDIAWIGAASFTK